MRKDLTKGPVFRTLIKMSLPMAWGLFSVIGFTLADTYFVGQLGRVELAAISFTFPVIFMLGSLAMGIGVGASSVIARAIGEKDDEGVRCLATDSLLLGLVIVGIALVAGLGSIDFVFPLMGADELVMPFIRDYMRIWYWGMFFLIVPMIGNSVIRATGDTVSPAVIMTIAGLGNIVLDPILIFGYFGLPAMGMAGAAVASVIARAVTLVFSLYILVFRYRLICFVRPTLKRVLDSWKRILWVGGPTAGANMLIPLGISVITALMAQFGHAAVAAFGIIGRIESFAMIMIIGMVSALSSFVGQNYGAKKYDRMMAGVRASFLFSIVWGLGMAAVLFLFGERFLAWFNDDVEVVRIGLVYLGFVPLSYGIQGLWMLASTMFNAMGKPVAPTVMILVRMFVLYLPLAYLGAHYWGWVGVFWAEFVGNVLIGGIAFAWVWWFRRVGAK